MALDGGKWYAFNQTNWGNWLADALDVDRKELATMLRSVNNLKRYEAGSNAVYKRPYRKASSLWIYVQKEGVNETSLDYFLRVTPMNCRTTQRENPKLVELQIAARWRSGANHMYAFSVVKNNL